MDVAALFREPAPASFEVPLPSRFDLLVLNGAPLELAGRVAMQGVLVFDDDPVAGRDGARAGSGSVEFLTGVKPLGGS